MQDHEMYSTWTDDSDKGKAFAEASEAYTENAPVQQEKALAYTYRTYLDIEPNRSVRTSITRNDYYRFRPEEAVPTRQKRIMKMCMDAYDRVGIVRNVIDLMGDFGGEGMSGYCALARTYNRVLSPQEILGNYNAQKSRFGL